MKLPQAVQYCITSLEAAGFRAFAVGGCVRDSLLGLTPADFDLCTSATPEQIAQVFARHQMLHHGETRLTIGSEMKLGGRDAAAPDRSATVIRVKEFRYPGATH